MDCRAANIRIFLQALPRPQTDFFTARPKRAFFLWSIREKGPDYNSARNCCRHHCLWHDMPLSGRLSRSLHDLPFSAFILRLVHGRETPKISRGTRRPREPLNSGIAASVLRGNNEPGLMQGFFHGCARTGRRTIPQRCHLMFLSAEPDETRRKALIALQGEEYRFHVQGKVLYYAYSRKYEGNRRRTIDLETVPGIAGTARTGKLSKSRSSFPRKIIKLHRLQGRREQAPAVQWSFSTLAG